MFTDVVTDVTLFDVIGIGLSIGQIDGCGAIVVVVGIIVDAVVTAAICDKFDNCGGGRIDDGACCSVFEFI